MLSASPSSAAAGEPSPRGLRAALEAKGLMGARLRARGSSNLIFAADLPCAQGTSRRVAVKCLAPEFETHPGARRSLLDEAQTLASLAHPRIASWVAAAPSGVAPYLIVDWVDGLSLAQIIVDLRANAAPLPLRWILRWMVELLSALVWVHGLAPRASRRVHRDVTPQNVLVSRDGAVTLLDWGSAHAPGRLAAECRGEVAGRPGYAPPELEERQDCRPSDDVFSAAVVLWELLAFRRLFFGASFAATRRQVRALGSLSVPLARAGLPGVLRRALARALHPRAAKRFASALEFRAALMHAAADPQTQTPADPILLAAWGQLFGSASPWLPGISAPCAALLSTFFAKIGCCCGIFT